jgi:hypothetical protein
MLWYCVTTLGAKGAKASFRTLILATDEASGLGKVGAVFIAFSAFSFILTLM